MKKLLHERLREFPEGSFYNDLGETLGLGSKPDNELLGDYWDRIIPALADEIERYYIPRPRFEDGEPVQFGDEFIIDRYMQEPEVLTRLAIFTKEQLEEWEQYYGIAPVYEMNFVRPSCNDGKKPIIKRPQPKVLDADGVEIKVGDMVWCIDTGTKLKVISQDCMDGTLLCNNDFVYDPEVLTHKEPDSLEKLRNDMDEQAKNGGDEGVLANVDEWVDRLSALIERSA